MSRWTLAVGMVLLPLAVTRLEGSPAGRDELQVHAHFTTAEATQASVDVSPDGRTLVFDLLGELYILPISGGNARAITHGTAWNSYPRFSPDGRSVVYVSDRDGTSNVWTIGINDGHVRRVTEEWGGAFLTPVFANAGRVVVPWSRPGTEAHYDLWSYSIPELGSNQRDGVRPARVVASRITNECGTRGVDPQSPDRKEEKTIPCQPFLRLQPSIGPQGEIYFASTADSYLQTDSWRVQVIQQHKTRTIPLLQADDSKQGFNGDRSAVIRPVISPDGRLLAYVFWRNAMAQWRLRDLSSGSDKPLLPSEPHYFSRENPITSDLMPAGAFIPDGRGFVAFNNGKLWRVDLVTGTLSEIPFVATVDRTLSPLSRFNHHISDGPVVARQIMGASLSPDGTRLAFTALDHLYVMRLPKGTPRRITADHVGEFSATWSPDGRYLAYVTWDDLTGGDVRRVRLDRHALRAESPQRLTTERGMYLGLAYSADGNSLLAGFTGFQHTRALQVSTQAPGDSAVPDRIDLVSFSSEGGPLQRGPQLANPSAQLGTELYVIPGRLVQARSGDDIYYFRLAPEGGTLFAARLMPPSIRPIIQLTGHAAIEDLDVSPDGKAAIATQYDGVYLIRGLRDLSMDRISLRLGHQGSISVTKISPTQANEVGWSRDGRIAYYTRGKVFHTFDLATARRTAHAITVAVPRDIARGTVVFRNAHLITMRGRETIEAGDLVVRNSRIVAIGRNGAVKIPRGTRVIDASGLTILPGWVDLHHHVFSKWSKFRQQPWEYVAALSFGATTIRDPNNRIELVTDGDRADAGDVLAPRVYTTGEFSGLPPRDAQSISDVAGLRRAHDILSYFSANGTETAKISTMGNESDLPETSRRLQQWNVAATRMLGLTPTVHQGEFRQDVELIIDGYAGHEHPYPVGAVYDDLAQLSARSGLTYTQTLGVTVGWTSVSRAWELVNDMRLARFFPGGPGQLYEDLRADCAVTQKHSPAMLTLLARSGAVIARAGGRIGMGSHGDANGPYIHLEMWAMAAGGMTPIDVLRSATILGAEALGHGKDFGSLEVGKLADLQVLSANPLEDIHNTTSTLYVMKEGRLYDALTLDEVYPDRKHRESAWWVGLYPQLPLPQHGGQPENCAY